MPPLIARIVASVATLIATWVELLLAEHLGITVSPDEHAWLVATIVGSIFATYGAVHWGITRWLAKRQQRG